MTDFLLELRSEEIPARMQAGARGALEKLFREQMDAAGVAAGAITVWSTPRRLALIAAGLPEATAALSEEVKGPRSGAPPQALEGFLRKTGLSEDQLIERDGVYFAVTEKPGRATRDLLADAVPAIVRAFPWPKSQRWGAASISPESLRWVRPLSGIVAILGEELVACEVGGVAASYATRGHRFHHPGEITIGGAHDYQDKLRACHVIVDHAERERLIRDKAAAAADAAGLALVEDEGLVVENAGLTEWPVPLLGRFDEAYLEVPPEVIQLTARTNQKYFICTNPPRARLGEGDRSPQASGGGVAREDLPPSAAGAAATSPSKRGDDFEIANAFVCTANIEARDGGAEIVAGNRKVLGARLADARFFWEQDRRKTLAEHAKGLERITFHEKLGTVADKVERVAKLARWLVEEGIVQGADADHAEHAARLAKADLVTEMVGEFPELQGLMGGYYARAEDLPDEVADAIRDHYKPVGQGDDVPAAPVTIAVSLADKLDTIGAFWAADEKPTGSKDPFALRRAAIAINSLILTNQLRVGLMPVLDNVCVAGSHTVRDAENAVQMKGISDAKGLGVTVIPGMAAALNVAKPFGRYNRNFIDKSHDLLSFFADRLKVQQREAGVRHDLIDAVFALGGEDDLVRLLARVQALQSFVGTPDGANLLAGYKRAANILRKEDWHGIEGEIARTGEEDPLANVDDPDLKAVVAAKMAERHHTHEVALPYAPEPAERALIDALDSAEPSAAAAVEAEDFAGSMAALASLRAPIDAFFDSVTVNDADPDKRLARLALLDRFRVAVHKVADFSKIEG